MSDPVPAPRRRFALDLRLVIGLLLVAASVAAVTMLVGAADSPVPVFDTTALHARAAVDAALAG